MLWQKVIGGTASNLILEYITKTDVDNASITIPSTSQIGDLAVLIQTSINSGSTAPAGVTPTNWTNIVNTGANSSSQGTTRCLIDYKILVSGDPNSSVTGTNHNSSNHKTMLIFRLTGKTISSVITDVGINYSTQTQNVDPPAQTISVTGKEIPILMLANLYSRSTASGYSFVLSSSSSPSFSTVGETGTRTDGALEYGYTVYNSSASDIIIDLPQTLNVSGPRIVLQGVTLEVS
jgi:hypothetical protein